MNMAINVCEYGRGEKCVNMFRHTYAAGIREMKMQMEKKLGIFAGLCVHE